MKNNNAMHYKMYKAKKNIVYAGLVTTAMLAGLTLTNVNNNVHADTTAAQTTEVATAQTATTPEVQSAQAAVSAASNQVTSAQAAVSDAQNAVASAQNLNSDVAAVQKANDAYKAAIDNQNQAGKASAQAQSNYNQASANAQDAIQTAATNKKFDATDQQAGQKAVAYWNAISGEAASTAASATAARPAYEQKVTAAQDAYDVQSNYVADLAAKANALSAQASTAAANKDANASALATAYSAMFKKYDEAAYQLNTHYAYQLNSAKVDVQYFDNVLSGAAASAALAKDALTKVSAFLTAKAANETAYQNVQAAVAATSKAEDAYVKAMNEHNLPNSQQLQNIENTAAVNNNWAKYYQE
ncbi:KxYKxGKxW signal peptide domain-containing protein [Limosilactobacillus oris]|uniref:KxYKxGKxW signal peptide domain-containing protein n=1 Tax=Limosilactobacillus oris TaxID=1632 RepID=UPI0024B3BE7C|nr:KxYKxGKxW signal peptide domain-containing protein [Limosilactobacillus oris]WHO85870.1 KxYKxGKxW signal peptide domain-containing protein [Limosilactobacillus oris]